MLLSKELDAIVKDFMIEAKQRALVKAVLPQTLLEDEHFWQLVGELFVNEVHRHNCLIVKQRDTDIA